HPCLYQQHRKQLRRNLLLELVIFAEEEPSVIGDQEKKSLTFFHWIVSDLHLSFEKFTPEFIKHIFSIFSNSLKHLEPLFNNLIFNLLFFSIMNESLNQGYIFCQHFEIFLAVPLNF
ncbi:hypothetical protein H5410_053268, partial [Solanum commersonii]